MNRFKSCTIDELGRVLLSGELRKKQGWKEKDTISMYSVDENTVILKRDNEAPVEPESTGQNP